MWLSSKQVQELTRRKRPSAQIRVLVDAGIPFQVVDGRPIVTDNALNTKAEKRVRRL